MKLRDQYEKLGEWYAEIKIGNYVYIAKFVAQYRNENNLPTAAFMGQSGYALTSIRYEPAEQK